MAKSAPSKTRLILAENMKRLRKEQNLSQEALADAAELHRTYIGAIEQGKQNISVDNIEKVANALGVEPYILLKSKD